MAKGTFEFLLLMLTDLFPCWGDFCPRVSENDFKTRTRLYFPIMAMALKLVFCLVELLLLKTKSLIKWRNSSLFAWLFII